MCVDLRGGNVSVTEQFLDHAQVGPAGEQVCCKAVSQHVWVNFFHACVLCIASYNLPDRDAFQRSPRCRKQQTPFVAAITPSYQLWAQFGEVVFDTVLCRSADGYKSLLRSFAGDFEDADFGVIVAAGKCAELGGAQAASIHNLEHRAIAQPEFTMRWRWRLEKFLHLLWTQNTWQSLPLSGRFEKFGRVFFDAIVGCEIAKEDAQRCKMPGNRAGLHVAIEAE